MQYATQSKQKRRLFTFSHDYSWNPLGKWIKFPLNSSPSLHPLLFTSTLRFLFRSNPLSIVRSEHEKIWNLHEQSDGKKRPKHSQTTTTAKASFNTTQCNRIAMLWNPYIYSWSAGNGNKDTIVFYLHLRTHLIIKYNAILLVVGKDEAGAWVDRFIETRRS